MIGDAGHGNPLAFAGLAAREYDVKLAGDQYGVVVEGLVKVAEAKHKNRIWETLLQLEILPPKRRQLGRSRRVQFMGPFALSRRRDTGRGDCLTKRTPQPSTEAIRNQVNPIGV